MQHNPMDPTPVMDLANAFYGSCILFTASDLGIFACCARLEEADADGVAEACNLDPRATRLLLNACVALGLMEQREGRYRNSAVTAACLVPGSPMDLSKAIRYNRDVYAAWGKLPELLHSGKPVEPPELHLGADKDRTRSFVLAMHNRAMGIGRAVIPMLELGTRRRLLDVGGGSGAYSMLAARANPDLECVVFDLPEVVHVANELIDASDVGERVSCLPGDYHVTPLPTGFDAVCILGVLHQESPGAIVELLRRCHEAMHPDGVIYIMDMMTDETGCRPAFSALFAVNMALTTQNGWVFSSRELEGWLKEAGFVDVHCRPLPPPMPHWLATARRGGADSA